MVRNKKKQLAAIIADEGLTVFLACGEIYVENLDGYHPSGVRRWNFWSCFLSWVPEDFPLISEREWQNNVNSNHGWDVGYHQTRIMQIIPIVGMKRKS